MVAGGPAISAATTATRAVPIVGIDLEVAPVANGQAANAKRIADLVNLRTAKILGLTMSLSLLVRAAISQIPSNRLERTG